MAKDLGKDDDVQESLDSLESRGGNILKIPEGKTPVYILNGKYADGYAHWVKLAEGNARVVCAGGTEAKGWAPEECDLCTRVAALFKRAKTIEQKHGDTDEVKSLRRVAGRIRAKYEAHFLAVRGELVKEKQRDGTKRAVPDFDEGRVGILSFTRQQFEDFVGLRKSETFSFMKDGEDLTNRVLLLDKRKRGDSIFATTEFIPSKRVSDPPDVEYEEDEFDLEEDFVVDTERIEGAAEYLKGGGGTKDDDEEDVEFEDEEEEDVDDDFLDDVDDEEEKSKPKKSKKGRKVAEEEEEDDDFEDDIPGEDEEEDEDEEKPKPRTKTRKKTSAASKSKSRSTKRRGTSSKRR